MFFVRMAKIPSAALVFGEDLVCKLEIEDSLDTEGAIGWHTLGLC